MPLDETTQSSFVMRLAILEEKVRALERCDASRHATGGIYDRLDKLERRQGVVPRPPAPQESAADYHRDMAIQYRAELNKALALIEACLALAKVSAETPGATFFDVADKALDVIRLVQPFKLSRAGGGPSAE